jgi:acetoacetyl-CoA reductase
VTGTATWSGLAPSSSLSRVYSRDKEIAQRFLDSYGKRGASVHQGNIGSNEDFEWVIQEVLNQHGRLDILKVVARIPAGRL